MDCRFVTKQVLPLSQHFATCPGWAPPQVHQEVTAKGSYSSSRFFTFSCFIEILSISPHLLLVLPDYWVSYSSVSKRLNCPLEKAIMSWRRRSHFYSIPQETVSGKFFRLISSHHYKKSSGWKWEQNLSDRCQHVSIPRGTKPRLHLKGRVGKWGITADPGQHPGAQRLCRLRGAGLACRDANCREERINTVSRHGGGGTASLGF